LQCGHDVDSAVGRVRRAKIGAVQDEVTTADLLTAWREASRAAELAERLARMALETAERADAQALASEEIAALAREAAESATRAADFSTSATSRPRVLPRTSRASQIQAAEQAVVGAHAEQEAKRLYHEAEADARKRHKKDGTE
jgi:hypothetical protein